MEQVLKGGAGGQAAGGQAAHGGVIHIERGGPVRRAAGAANFVEKRQAPPGRRSKMSTRRGRGEPRGAPMAEQTALGRQGEAAPAGKM